MDPEFAFQFQKRMELERTRQLEYERMARERIDVTGGIPRGGWNFSVRRWWKALGNLRVTTTAPSACCAAPVICA